MGLLFRAGQEKQCVNITILDDDVFEDQEVFNAALTTAASIVTLNPDHAVVNISDDDGKCKRSLRHSLKVVLYPVLSTTGQYY